MKHANFSIAVLPGDGIGPEVVAEAVRVLQAVGAGWDKTTLSFHEHPVGAGEYVRNGDPLPQTTFDACVACDAVLFGAAGLPDVRWPDGKEVVPQIDLRERLELYGGLRPIRLYHANDSPLKRYNAGEIDFVIVRESTEGLFSGRSLKQDRERSLAEDVRRITRCGSERLLRVAFRPACQRRGIGSRGDK